MVFVCPQCGTVNIVSLQQVRPEFKEYTNAVMDASMDDSRRMWNA